jgi:glucose/arabinose dehydrogenase
MKRLTQGPHWLFIGGTTLIAAFAAALAGSVACTSDKNSEASNARAPVAQGLPAGFKEELVVSGRTQPTAVRFASNGRIFVAEKSGMVWTYASAAAPGTAVLVADLRANVHNYWDRGLVGLAVDPNFPKVPHIYVLYPLDAGPDGTIPRWGKGGSEPSTTDSCPTPPGATKAGCVVYGRLSRIVIDPSTLKGTEQPLLSGNWCQQFPGHSTGDLVFGTDGMLYASAGEGANFNYADFGQAGDPINPCGDPPDGVGGPNDGPDAEGGSLRSQDLMTSGDPTAFNGAVLRIDVRGSGATAPPDNPMVGVGRTDDDLVLAIGLRTPFRLAARPGGKDIWIADVGWSKSEELNRIESPSAPVANFGWPCYEGPNRNSSFQSNLLCQRLYSGDLPPNMERRTPYYSYQHTEQVVEGDSCGTGDSSITGIAFNTNSSLPARYRNALFFADSTRKCIWTMAAGEAGVPDPKARAFFAKTSGRITDMQMGPDGKLYYLDFDGGRVYRIAYYSDNTPPEAKLSAEPTSGAVPLTVRFDASESQDAEDGSALSFAWDVDGDGSFDDGSGPTLSYTYTAGGQRIARVRVTDSGDLSSEASLSIVTNNTKPVPVIDSPASDLLWTVGQRIAFSGHATDAESGELAPEQLSWSIIIHHCASEGDCHEHPVTGLTGAASGSVDLPDHEYPAFLELRLTATDGPPDDETSLSASTSVMLQPRTATLAFRTEPPGLPLAIGLDTRATPYSAKAISGSMISVTAPEKQVVNGVEHVFQSWSDGGKASHTVIVSDTTPELVARYVDIATCLDGGI